ncbi:MAG TPA: hypothetical protein VEK08_23740 [Planctomycetota bacterium]|nr:hypothetical protein [Planctomycetota bacterium]
MRFWFCETCGSRLTDSDVVAGHAFRIGECFFCKKCCDDESACASPNGSSTFISAAPRRTAAFVSKDTPNAPKLCDSHSRTAALRAALPFIFGAFAFALLLLLTVVVYARSIGKNISEEIPHTAAVERVRVTPEPFVLATDAKP